MQIQHHIKKPKGENSVSSQQSIYEVFLFEGSPFHLPFNEQSVRAIATNAPILSLQIATVRELVLLFGRHLDYLKSHPELFARFGTTAPDLGQYMKGVLAPLEIANAAYFRVQGKQKDAEFILDKWDKIDSGRYSAFLKSKVDQCAILLKQDKEWEEIFGLAYGYDMSNYYRVGIAAAEMAFEGYVMTIFRMLEMGGNKPSN